jgi:hypothetical protein
MSKSTAEILTDALEQASAAHGVYEAEVLGGVYDVKWPEWYAEHMARGFAEGGYRVTRY